MADHKMTATMEAMLPPPVVLVEAGPSTGDQPLLPEEVPLVSRAVDVRRREFSAGRACARLALARLGIHDIPILSGPRREPLWPPGVAGSITHCQGYTAAAVVRTREIAALGIDAEVIGVVGEDLEEMIATSVERRRYGRGLDPGPLWRTLLFSMKESAFKALFPLLKIELEFHDLEVGFDRAERTFTIANTSASARAIPLDFRALRGRFAVAQSHVFTAVWLPGERSPSSSSTRPHGAGGRDSIR